MAKHETRKVHGYLTIAITTSYQLHIHDHMKVGGNHGNLNSRTLRSEKKES